MLAVTGHQHVYELMEQMVQQYPLADICGALSVPRSGYYAHKKKPFKKRKTQERELIVKIKNSFVDSRKTYGSPRIQKDLKDLGLKVGRNRINRLMRQQGLVARQKRKWRPTTTQSNPKNPVAPNYWARFPRPDKVNQVWVADITYIWTAEGWLYLSGIMDACSRKIVGWHTREDLQNPLVTEAWNKALASRRPDPGLLHHSDRGSQYTSSEFNSLLQNSGAAASMSRKGNCYDNAHQESFWATLKTECFGDSIPQNKHQAKLMIFEYIHVFYNPRRRHSSLGYLSPDQFEENLFKLDLDQNQQKL